MSITHESMNVTERKLCMSFNPVVYTNMIYNYLITLKEDTFINMYYSYIIKL